MIYSQNITQSSSSSTIEKARNLATQDLFPFSILPTPHVIKTVTTTVSHFLENASRVVFFGIGGSCLSGRVFASYAPSNLPMTFIDNVDPWELERTEASWDWNTTHCVFTSKSGETAETLAQLAWIKKKLSSARITKQCLVITQPAPSSLRTFAQDNAVPIIDCNLQVPGRFSAFTATGLVPLICAHKNALHVIEAAYNVYDSYIKNPQDHPVTQSVAWILWNHNNKRPLSVLMPYAHRHYALTQWWRQLWAESLGKKSCEFLPIDAYGTTDQHSQLQLYLDGADSRYFTLIMPDDKAPSSDLQACAHLFYRCAHATRSALLERQRPLRTWGPQGDTSTAPFLAALMMHMFLETTLIGKAYSINPFDQPAVELIKYHLKSLNAQ